MADLPDRLPRVGERVRVTQAHRCGSELKHWQRHLAGRCGQITAVFQRQTPGVERLMIDLDLDPLSPRQRTCHVATLVLYCAYLPQSVDRVEYLDEEVVPRG